MFPETSLNAIVLFLLSPLPILLSSQVHFHLLVVIPLSSFGSPSARSCTGKTSASPFLPTLTIGLQQYFGVPLFFVRLTIGPRICKRDFGIPLFLQSSLSARGNTSASLLSFKARKQGWSRNIMSMSRRTVESNCL
jgi:hypothetical protein